MKVNIVKNPKHARKRKRSKRKAATTMAAPKKRRRRRRKSRSHNPSEVAYEPNPRRRSRRRRRTKNTGGGIARRRNAGGGGGLILSRFMRFVPRLAGKVFVAFCVRRWGGTGAMFGGATSSPTAGGSWSLGQYVLAVLATEIGARFFGRFVSAEGFREGGWDLILTKLVWTEGFARSPWLAATFGNTGIATWDPATGQTWMSQGGEQVAMQGIVDASPLDGIVDASPLDGGMGHLLPPGTDPAWARQASYTGAAYTNPYQAAYSYQGV